MSENRFTEIFDRLFQYYGPQGWWPAESVLEMIVGAVLTQNTSWKNVEKSIAKLKVHNLLFLETLVSLSYDELAQLIRSSGYYNLKAKRLKNLLQMIWHHYDGDLDAFIADEMHSCRDKLLQVKGVGEETADSILLYACNHPIFVVDTYTHRVFSRHHLVEEESTYADIQERFMDNLPADSQLFNEYHALIVKVCKDYCRKTSPLCESCPLKGM